MSEAPVCPECKSEYAYEDGAMWVCPDCGHEWNPSAEPEAVSGGENLVFYAQARLLGIP